MRGVVTRGVVKQIIGYMHMRVESWSHPTAPAHTGVLFRSVWRRPSSHIVTVVTLLTHEPHTAFRDPFTAHSGVVGWCRGQRARAHTSAVTHHLARPRAGVRRV